MAKKKMFRTKSRRLAFVLLMIFGAFVILFGLAVLSIGLAITHNDTFHKTTGLQEMVEPGIDYVQYWVGLPYLITGVSIACSAVNLRRAALIACTLTLSIACIVLSLAGLVLDGPDFRRWKDYRARQDYWEKEDGYACSSINKACTCVGKTKSVNVTSFTDCETLGELSTLYGVLIGCIVIGLVVLLAAIVMIVYVITTKREKAARSGKPVTRIIEVTGEENRYEQSPPITNRGFESDEQKVTPVIPSYRAYKSFARESDSTSAQNRSGTLSDGMVMLDPGRFQLSDDDVY